MSKPVTFSENIQVRLPEGTLARMRDRTDVPLSTFWRVKMLNWLDRPEEAKDAD